MCFIWILLKVYTDRTTKHHTCITIRHQNSENSFSYILKYSHLNSGQCDNRQKVVDFNFQNLIFKILNGFSCRCYHPCKHSIALRYLWDSFKCCSYRWTYSLTIYFKEIHKISRKNSSYCRVIIAYILGIRQLLYNSFGNGRYTDACSWPSIPFWKINRDAHHHGWSSIEEYISALCLVCTV